MNDYGWQLIETLREFCRARQAYWSTVLSKDPSERISRLANQRLDQLRALEGSLPMRPSGSDEVVAAHSLAYDTY